ncbi:hypothetical protein QP027_10660 [Corynebacterium breve]|uniref:Uncharacterized protein n=1 Tax=Corynebacterium breve TaxID=3049799 RepID=A0ABY8VDG9_9CORY|nr:hypothetical protein [Corynebacterium breve]WIM67543.1 hypothetical protein QP027_10660 [Corynebacterium breve]
MSGIITSKHTPITAKAAAALLSDRFEEQTGGRPSITAPKVTMLVKTGVLDNLNPSGTRILLSREQVEDFADNTTYIPDYDDLELDAPVFRVSLVEQCLNPVFDVYGKKLREYSGFDYANHDDLDEETQRGGYEGAWSVSDANADFLVETNAYLVPTTKGYVRAGNIRRITGCTLIQDSPRKYFITDELSPEDEFYTDPNKGYWIDVPAGRESGIDWVPAEYEEDAFEDTDEESTETDSADGEGDTPSYSLDELIAIKLQQIRDLDELIARKEAEEAADNECHH